MPLVRASRRTKRGKEAPQGGLYCKRCADLGVDHYAFKAQCEGSLYDFVKYFVSDWVIPEIHGAVIDWFTEERAAGANDFLVMFARRHLKSTVFSIGYPLWRVVQTRGDIRLNLVMLSGGLAAAKLKKIKNVAQGQNFKHFWGDLVPEPTAQGAIWTKEEVQFNSLATYEEPTITASGAKKKQVGGHYDEIILDDLVDGSVSSSTLQINAALSFLSGVEGMWVNPDKALLLIVGTAWPGGFYEPLLKDESFKKCIFGCRVDDRYLGFMQSRGLDTSSFKLREPLYRAHGNYPARETEKTLARAKKRFKSMYANQMDNVFLDDKLRQFRAEDIQYFKWGDDEKKSVMVDGVYYPVRALFVQTTVDPGGSGKYSEDASAVVTTGWARGIGVGFVLDSWHARTTTKPVIEETLRQAEAWGSRCIRAEHAAMQSILTDWLQDEMRRRKKSFKLDPVAAGHRSKVERLLGLQPFIASHQVYFRQDQPDLPNELAEIVIVGNEIKGASPNLADALAYSTGYWRSSPPAFLSSDEIPFVEEQDEIMADHEVRYRLQCPTRASFVRASL